MSLTSNEKSYGGYSSFSPMRNAERTSDKKERNENIPAYVHDKVEEIMGNQKEKDEGKDHHTVKKSLVITSLVVRKKLVGTT
jgi:hypothetical protein